jgi:glycosyltransferase involved in cell wall biosynthesis
VKILLITTNPPSTVASTRYRLTQYMAPLREGGHHVDFSTFYPDGGPAARGTRLLHGLRSRAHDVLRAGEYDVAVIHREILPYGWNHLCRLLRRRVPFVFDFDDAVFLAESSRLRPSRYASTRLLVDASELVFAGNEFLASYARRTQPRVSVLPTVVDTDVYRPRAADRASDGDRIPVVGWIGSPSTSPYLEPVLPILDELALTRRFRLRIVGATKLPAMRNLEIERPPWSATTEAAMFADLDIGLYPLPNDLWVLGKCGFKAIQYMACGIPCVVSPFGVVRDIVRDGVDGHWAYRPADYHDALASLLDSPELRARMGAAGRARVVESYSLRSTAPKFVEGLRLAAGRRS